MARCPPALMPFDGTALRLAAPMLGRDGPRAGGVERGGRGESDEARRSLSSSNGALIAYLDDKIRGARGRGDRVACTALGAWLTELHLCEREAAAGASSSTSGTPATGPAKQARTMLRQHLSSYVRDMDPTTVLGILEGHGVGAGEVAGYAAAAGDVGAAVEAALSGEDEKVSFGSNSGGLGGLWKEQEGGLAGTGKKQKQTERCARRPPRPERLAHREGRAALPQARADAPLPRPGGGVAELRLALPRRPQRAEDAPGVHELRAEEGGRRGRGPGGGAGSVPPPARPDRGPGS
ncbi:hypothetical protein THAOC_19264, partial [Thalassiosira oceanica]